MTDRIAGLEMGADAYVTNPYDLWEVITRVWARVRSPELTSP
ncbi:MAG TPA: hypothetical protein VFI27_17185 [candidate division Zixibacteria bacterium]|nr:hypothetical protein [candidate division Zixibacteria bacterium]